MSMHTKRNISALVKEATSPHSETSGEIHLPSVSSTEKDINTRLAKACTALDRQSVIWKSGLTNKIKRSFFQAAVVSIPMYGCTT